MFYGYVDQFGCYLGWLMGKLCPVLFLIEIQVKISLIIENYDL